MGKIEMYRETLKTLHSWDSYLLQESRLPGPRSNLELAFAVALEGEENQLRRYAALDAEEAPANTPREFLAVCGVIGLGYLAARGIARHFDLIREKASDPRWRIRESVALGLQKFGQTDMERLLRIMEQWNKGNALERRAVVATLCEPILLRNRDHVRRVLDIMDSITASVLDRQNENAERFKVLRKGLAYGWSVVVAAQPEIGKTRMEKWIGAENPDIRWIMKQNLKKNRLTKMDEVWVKDQLKALEQQPKK